MSKLKVNRPQPPKPQPKLETPEVELISNEPETDDDESTEDEGYPFNLQYDELEGRVTFQTYDGTQIELKSPKAKQFLQIQSWLQSAPEEYQSDVFAVMKMAHACMSQYNQTTIFPDFETFLDSLEVEDIERVGTAIAFFRKAFNRFSNKTNKV